MPEHLRALIVILALACIVFAFARRPAVDLIPYSDFTRRRNLWLALSVLAFISHSFWLYVVVTAIVLTIAQRRERNPLALFFILLFLIPPAPMQIPGFGLINYFFALDHVRLLALLILLPAFFTLRRRAGTLAFGRTWPDKLLVLYLLLSALLHLRETTLTDTLRQTLYLFTDVFLPYYVASRALKQLSEFKDAMLAFALAAMVLALIGVFEYARHWLLYNSLIDALGMHWGMSNYLGRGGSLRASASTGQAIVLGYVISVAIGFYLFLHTGVRSRLQQRLGALLLAVGLFAPLSRGPWLGAAAMITVFIATGRNAAKRLMLLGLAGVLALPLLSIIPGGNKLIDLLPYIGTIEKGNITYRERLFDNSMIVIQRNPILGSIDYLSTPEMQSMIQGEGIIDIVNTYLSVTLESGLTGLALFAGFFTTIVLGIRKSLRTFQDKDDETLRLGRALLATLLGVLLTIMTVSSISVIPVVYWSLAGLGVAYIQMVRGLRPPHATDAVAT
ncbi:O-antigen ligase family protein [Pseudomonas sp.]|uniref:O-antigen ligase family protein n=1 Tax=Pseudomonas sp. TaxID=306 RepID=UPI00299F08D2|nr:O-antigen ligase family protein [Pseudomonas sp.]MDX1366003.1 O-antigen ligase family protein [Pseudomonas sp.]